MKIFWRLYREAIMFPIAILIGVILYNGTEKLIKDVRDVPSITSVKQYLKSAIKKVNANSHWTLKDFQDVSEILDYAWKKWNIHPKRALAHWMHESRLRKWATGYNSGSIDKGIAQINSGTEPWLRNISIRYCRLNNLKIMERLLIWNGPYNIRVGTFMSLYYIHMLQKQYGMESSIVAYNAGRPVPLRGCFLAYHNSVVYYESKI